MLICVCTTHLFMRVLLSSTGVMMNRIRRILFAFPVLATMTTIVLFWKLVNRQYHVVIPKLQTINRNDLSQSGNEVFTKSVQGDKLNDPQCHENNPLVMCAQRGFRSAVRILRSLIRNLTVLICESQSC